MSADNLGNRIREKRESLGLTQHELAVSLKLTPQHISAIEQGKRLPSIESLASLAKELGVSIDYLVTGNEGAMTDIIPAIRADKSLPPDVKKAIITIVEYLQRSRAEN